MHQVELSDAATVYFSFKKTLTFNVFHSLVVVSAVAPILDSSLALETYCLCIKVIMHKKDMEPEKTDKQMAALAPMIKTGSDVAPLSISAALLVKTRTSKKSGAKKDSGDSDSVSSDIVIAPKTSVLNASTCPSGKLLTEVTKSSGMPQRLTKEDERHVQTSSSKATKEEPARVTRGDLLKTTRESAGKEDRPSVRKVEGRDIGRTKGEAEKNVEEKEEKQRGSRRVSLYKVQKSYLEMFFYVSCYAAI